MSIRKIGKDSEQDINYDNITMEMSEDSSQNEDSTNGSDSDDSQSSSESQQSDNGKKPSKKVEYSHKSEEKRRHSPSPDDHKGRDDKKKKYIKDSHHRDRDREERRPYRRSRSPSYHKYDASRRSRSRSPRDRGRHSRRHHHSPERRRRDHHERSRGISDRKPNRLSVLDKLGIELKLPDKEKDGSKLSLPSYYNPMVVNPAKYAEQIAKRKLLWGNSQKEKPLGEVKEVVVKEPVKSSSSAPNIWQGARFSQDQDGKLTAKFQRLMGIKNANGPEQPAGTSQPKTGKDLLKKQEEMFSSMEMQYEVARQATHTQRGVGLGFGAHHFPPK